MEIRERSLSEIEQHIFLENYEMANDLVVTLNGFIEIITSFNFGTLYCLPFKISDDCYFHSEIKKI